MPVVPGLTIIIASPDPDRFHAALSVAAANAALGERSRVFLQGEAAVLLQPKALGRIKPGNPSLGALIEESVALGTEVSVCQSGLALTGMRADRLPAGVTTTGLVELLASRGDDQLMMA